MKRILSILFYTVFFSTPGFSQTATPSAVEIPPAEKAGILEKASHIKLPWVENTGRMDKSVAFYTPTAGGNMYVTKQGTLVYQTVAVQNAGAPLKTHQAPDRALNNVAIDIYGHVWYENFMNANPLSFQPQNISPSVVSYFTGNDPDQWQSAKSTWYTLGLGQVWKNIEVKLNRNGSSVEKRFYVYPGGQVSDIQIQVSGCEKLTVNPDGSLVTTGKPGDTKEEMSFSPPVAYQYIGGKKVPVAVQFVAEGTTYSFRTGSYNPAYALVIDPLLSTLTASTYIGGSYFDYANGITTDASGNVYIASCTLSTDFPTTPGAYQTYNAGNLSAFVSELSGDLSTLIASTYIGGGTSNNQAMDVNVGPDGNIYISGQTLATDYPTTNGAYQTTFGGGSFDGFVAKFNPGLTQLLASTFLGGSGSDLPYSMVFDNTGALYLCGFTTSSNFPATSGAYSTSLKGASNAFITKMDANLSTVLTSTFIGGSGNDYGYSIARDATGNLYISGQATSSDYPTIQGAYQPALNGASDTYVSKMNASLSSLLASTYFGGSGGEQTNNLVLDKNKNVYLTGWESSSDFPTSSGAFQFTYGGGQNDAYVSILDSSLSSLVASTYLGGSTDDYGYGLAVDNAGIIYVSGFTGGASSSSDFPTTVGAYQTTYGGGYYNAFVSILNNQLNTIRESTFIGNGSSEFGYYLSLTPAGNLYVNGQTQGSYPSTPGAYQTASNGAADAFVSRFGNYTTVIKPVAKFTVNKTTLCPGDTASFTDQSTGSPTSWAWTLTGASDTTSNAQNPAAVYNVPGTYPVKLVVSNTNGADSLTQYSYITVLPSTKAGNITGPPNALCAGDSTLLTDTGSAGSLQWQSSADGTLFNNLSGDTSASVKLTGLTQTTWYRVSASGGCGTASSAAFKLLVNPLPVPVITASDTLFCSGDSASLCTASPYQKYLWSTADTTHCTTVTSAGGYWVTVTDANHCSAVSAHQKINIYEVPSVSIIRQGDTLTSFGQVNYHWIRNGVPIDSATGQVYVARQSGSYAVQITDSNGCTTTSQPVTVTTGLQDLKEENISIYPNPNSVGSWQLTVGNELVGSTLEVYDEQGRLVMKDEVRTTKYEITAGSLPSGVYYLRISNDKASVVRKLVKM